jgi:hydrocephalus-inducing protein
VTFAPDGEVTLKPREVLPVEVRFHPKTRLPNFHLDILLEVEPNEPRKMMSLHGVSHGIELKLMDEVVAFGSVVRGSRLTKSLQLSNFGDVKAYYKWESKQYSKNFTINPESGYINPNSNLDLEVTFHPGKADPDIRYSKVPCWIKGGDKLELTLMGKSVEQDTSTTEELTFTTKVRQTTSQSVTVQNTEDKEWAINPTISTTGDDCKGYFTGKSTLVVPARGSAQYEVAYTPQTMTKLQKVKKQEGDQEVEVEEVRTHQGGLFFPLPNGTALLYRLVGTANEPDAEGELRETVTAKRAKSIIIPVKNWSRVSQRFHASWQVEGEADPALFIRGANAFDVGGQSTKEYKLNFLSLKSGRYRFQATFKAEKTGEYAFYHVDVTVEEPELVSTIELASQVREAVSQVISIENPTDVDVTISASEFQCDNEYIEITPPTLTVPARSERGFEVHYRPLIASEDEACDLVLQNTVLGAFKYKLLLRGLQPSSQRSLAFKCALGGDLVQAFKFTHYQKKPTSYAVKVERIDQPGAPSDFKAEVAQVSAPAAESHKGVEVSCSIRYEPFTIGDSRGVLKLTSPDGMDYTCLLFGKSTAPQPQGPIKCPAGAKPAAVDFKNPLNEKCEFLVTFDNANFSLASKLPGPLDPGKVTSLQVKYDAKPELPRTGRMMVNTKGLPPWVFYLQGE